MTPDELIHAQLDVLMEGIAELVAERDALREQVRVLREDAERYQWMRAAFTREDVDYYYLSSCKNETDIDEWVNDAMKGTI